MIKLNISQARIHLLHHLARLKPGETIQLCRRNTPIAEIRPLPVAPRKPRPIGLAKGKVKIHRRFFDPLPDDIIATFEGRDE